MAGIEQPPATIASDIGLNAEEIARRKQFLEFGAEDIELLTKLHARLEPQRDRFTAAFYDHLLSFEPLRALIGNDAAQARLRHAQSLYFSSLTEGEYGDAYVADRLRVGAAHQRIGLGPQWYIGAYRKYLGDLLPLIAEACGNDRNTFVAAVNALLKIVSFDMGLALDTYFHHEHQAVIRAQRHAAQILACAPVAILVLNPDMTIRQANRGFRSMLGIEADAPLSGRPCRDVLDLPVIAARAGTVLGGGDHVHDLLASAELPDGTHRYSIDISATHLDDTPALLVIIQDVTEEQLQKEALLRLRTALDLSPDMFTLVDRDTMRVVDANETASRTLGYSRDELLRLAVTDLNPGVPREVLESIYDRLLIEPGITSSREAEARTKNGSLIPVEITRCGLRIGTQRLVAVTARDISERKRSEQMLRGIVEGTATATGPEFLSSLAKNLAIALNVHWALLGALEDGNRVRTLVIWDGSGFAGNFTYDLAGTPCRNVIGKKACIYPRNVAALFPDDALLAQLGVESYMGVPVSGVDGAPLGILIVMDDQPMNPNEEIKSVLRIFAARAGAELERMRSERRLRESEELYRATFENAPVGVAHLDLDGHWLQVNPNMCEITGYSREEMLGFNYRDITHPEDLGPDIAGKEALLRGETGSSSREKRYLRKDGTPVWVHVRTSIVRAASGEPRHYVSVITDISERKAAQEEIHRLNLGLEQRVRERTAELEQANEEMEAFSYSLSHDLRAPLRSIAGFSHALQEDCGDRLDESGRDFLSRILGASQRMDSLIDDMLGLFRVSASPAGRARVDLGHMAQDIIGRLIKTEPRRVVDCRIARPLETEGDPGLLHAALENLLGNAWKYTSKRETALIEFGAGRDETGRTVYFVRDNGAGFDMKYADRLFAPFQRLHRADDFPGSGVGLATVQKIIRRHGGRIWAESTPGQGATFFFTLWE
jgi:PAS domain S-box-containing protein